MSFLSEATASWGAGSAVASVVLLAVALVVRKALFGKSELPYAHYVPPNIGEHAGVSSIQGRRAHMEDAYTAVVNVKGKSDSAFYGVFDGHGGKIAAHFVAQELFTSLRESPYFGKVVSSESNNKKNNNGTRNNNTKNNNNNTDEEEETNDDQCDLTQALKEAFLRTDRRFLELAQRLQLNDGSTGVVALLHEGVLYVANTGDSRAVLVSKTSHRRQGVQAHTVVATALSEDHKPNLPSERRRIQQAGGTVKFFGTWRVEGILAVARSFGDLHLKRYVPAEADVRQRRLEYEDAFLILASDGVWDVIDNEVAARVVARADSPHSAAVELTQLAYERGSADNITTLVVDLQPFFRQHARLTDAF